MAAAIRLAPGCTSTTIFDRQENKPVISALRAAPSAEPQLKEPKA